jgi:hypothetical protein
MLIQGISVGKWGCSADEPRPSMAEGHRRGGQLRDAQKSNGSPRLRRLTLPCGCGHDPASRRNSDIGARFGKTRPPTTAPPRAPPRSRKSAPAETGKEIDAFFLVLAGGFAMWRAIRSKGSDVWSWLQNTAFRFCGSFLIFLTLPWWHLRAEALPVESNALSCPGELRCRV